MTDHPAELTAEDLAAAVPDDTPQPLAASADTVTPEEVQTAVQAETAWLQGQLVTLLQQRTHTLHSTLLLNQRQLAAVTAQRDALAASITELQQAADERPDDRPDE